MRKQNEKDAIIRYKAQLVAQGFSQRSSSDYNEKYYFCSICNNILLAYQLHNLLKKLDVYMMNVITTYLYGSNDNDTYMKIPKEFKIP